MLEGLNIHHKNFPKNIITKFVCLVIIDERLPMGSQLNLASRSKVVLIYKYHAKIFGALTQNLGRTLGPLFSATSALDTAYLWNETKHGQTKMVESIYNVSSTR